MFGLATWLLLMPLVEVGAATRPADAPVTLESSAQDDAVQRLIDAVLRLEIGPHRTVSTLVAGSPAAEEALRTAVMERHQRSRARRVGTYGVEVDVWLAVAELNSIVRAVLSAHPPSASQPFADLPVDSGPAIVATGRAYHDGCVRDSHPGWRHCEPAAVEAARKAAAADARQAMLARIGSHRLSARQMIAHLFAEQPSFREAVQRRVDALPLSDSTLEPSGLCRQVFSLSRADLIHLLSRAAGEADAPIEADFSRVTDTEFADPVRVEGLGLAPPGRGVGPRGGEAAVGSRPEWAERFLTSKSSGRAPAGVAGRESRRSFAAEAARIEAMRILWLDIEALVLPNGDTIRSALMRHPQRGDAAAAISDAIFPVSMPVYAEDDSATITLGIRLETVWRVIAGAGVPASSPIE